MRFFTTNAFVACAPPEDSREVEARNGVAIGDAKKTITRLEVLFPNRDEGVWGPQAPLDGLPPLHPGDFVYVRGDQTTHAYLKNPTTIDGKQVFMVPRAEVQGIERGPNGPAVFAVTYNPPLDVRSGV